MTANLKRRNSAFSKGVVGDDTPAELKRRTSIRGISISDVAIRNRTASKKITRAEGKALKPDPLIMAAIRNTNRVRANSIKETYTARASTPTKKRSSAAMDVLPSPSKRQTLKRTASISSECFKVGSSRAGLSTSKNLMTGPEKFPVNQK